MWARRSLAVVIGFATLLAPAASWASSRPVPRTRAAAPPTVAHLPLRHAIDTTGVRQRERSAVCGDAANASSVAVRPASDGTLHAQTSDSVAPFDPVLVLRDDRGRIVGCNDDALRRGVEASLDVVVKRGRRYVLEVAGQGGSNGKTQLRAELVRTHAVQPMTGTGAISGVVRSRYDGKKITGVCVSAFDLYGDVVRTTISVTGAYRLAGLPPTQLRVGFLPCPGRPPTAYQPEYWNNARSLDRADLIPLRDGQQLGHIDADLSPWGNITGTVFDSTGKHPLAGICIDAESAIVKSVLHAVTSITGTYRLQVVSPMTQSYTLKTAQADWYTVSFHDCTSGVDASEWWNGAVGGTANPGAARPIHLDLGQAAANVNANLHAGGFIAGAVRSLATGVGVDGACVAVSAPGLPSRFAHADVTGRYRVGPLAPSDYKVFFSDCAHRKLSSQWWKNTADPAGALLAHVVGKQTLAGVNANLPARGSIAGTVVDEKNGDPLENMCVTLKGNDLPPTVRTNVHGRFRFSHLSAGPYVVAIRDCRGIRKFAYLDTYYQRVLDPALAKPVVVHPATKAVIVAKVIRSGAVAGVVRQAHGLHKVIVGACVDVIDVHSGATVAQMRSSVTGAYRLTVPPGSYQVRFAGCNGGPYITQYYNGSADRKHATAVTVGTSVDTSGIDAALNRGAAISGVVLDAYGYTPYYGVCVQARVGKAPGRVVAETRSDYLGRYEVGGLLPGRYHVEFGHCHGELDYYAPTFYYNSPTYDGSTAVVVDGTEVVTGIDGRLDFGGAIRGLLRDATGAPANGVCVEAIGNDPDTKPQFTQTNSSGEFYLYGLPAGQYHLRIGHNVGDDDNYGYSCAEHDFAESWYPKAIDEASSKTITLGVNQYLTIPDGVVFKAAQVTGFVTSAATGGALAVPCAKAYGSSGEVRGRAETIAPGIYAVFALPPDTYKVKIAHCGGRPYVAQFFDGAADLASATPIPLSPGQVRSDIGAALVPQGP
jgi:hypothetical protein